MAEEENVAEEIENEHEESEEEVGIEIDNDEVEKEESQAILTIAESVADKLKKQPSLISQASKSYSLKKQAEARKKCVGREPWDCEDEPLWRIYMKTYTDDARKRTEERIETYGEYYRPKPAKDLPCLPDASVSRRPLCYKLNTFNKRRLHLSGLPAGRMWENLRDSDLVDDVSTSASSVSTDFEWPKLHPCLKRDIIRERKILARKAKMKNLGALPCKIDEVDSPESSEDERMQELANLKELGHARIPLTASKGRKRVLIDRTCGERPGLVEGDYALFEFRSKTAERTCASICLRGLQGMYLTELTRVRQRTWKFCLYQALVALLTKTQLRYKYVWSANVDYIYEHAWMLFLHVGFLNVTKSQRFDDVLVYNYKYSIELELIQEINNVQVDPSVTFEFVEKTLRKQWIRPRKELTLMKSSFGQEKEQDKFKSYVHKSTKNLEKWFEQLEPQYTHCIYRTTRFALAFWEDGPFWYLYNPYRCNKYGFWDDSGAACIVKFCTRTSLKRHLMILTLRAYAYKEEILKNDKYTVELLEGSKDSEQEEFTVQIFQVIYHACQIHNVKLYNRKPSKPKSPMVEKKPDDPCTFDPYAHLEPKTCKLDENEKANDSNDEKEKPNWVRDMKINWMKTSSESKNDCKEENEKFAKWHMYDIIEPRRLYVLWGEAHIIDLIFPDENRGKQFVTCYAVCAGMIQINAPEYWTLEILNAIVVCGDDFYTQRKMRIQRLFGTRDWDDWIAHPKDEFQVGDIHFTLKALPVIQGRLYLNNDQCLWSSLERLLIQYEFLILSCENTRLGLFRHCGAYYACDVRSYGPPIFARGQGNAYVLRTACLGDLVRCIVLLIGSPECSEFELQPLKILKVMEQSDPCAVEVCKESKCGKDERVVKPTCPLENERKKAMKRKKWASADQKKEKTINKMVCTKKSSFN